MNGVERLARIALNTHDADRLAAFYVEALGFERVGTAAGVVSMALGASLLDLREVGSSARPYPDDVPGWSPLFQHCAIVVTDMARAMQSLKRSSGAWRAITTGGPQHLPANTGGVTAFKFRDPDGHPLELLAFPDAHHATTDAPFVRIDHSAISVADVARSIAFYEELGLTVSGRTLNVGPEQQRLDGVADACVDVVALALSAGTKPHVELLGYRGHPERMKIETDEHDIAATRLVFTAAADAAARLASSRSTRLLRDPDGHLIELEIASPA